MLPEVARPKGVVPVQVDNTARTNRPARVAVFGGVLAEARGKRSLGQIANKVGCARSTIFQLEQGTVEAPDPVLLLRLSAFYGIAFAELVRLLEWNRQHPDATETPSPAVTEGDMRVVGEDRFFIEKFRKLSPHARLEVLNFLEYQAQHSEVAATKGFPRRRGK